MTTWQLSFKLFYFFYQSILFFYFEPLAWKFGIYLIFFVILQIDCNHSRERLVTTKTIARQQLMVIPNYTIAYDKLIVLIFLLILFSISIHNHVLQFT